jgi:hypothetical protein
MAASLALPSHYSGLGRVPPHSLSPRLPYSSTSPPLATSKPPFPPPTIAATSILYFDKFMQRTCAAAVRGRRRACATISPRESRPEARAVSARRRRRLCLLTRLDRRASSVLPPFLVALNRLATSRAKRRCCMLFDISVNSFRRGNPVPVAGAERQPGRTGGG